MREFSKFAPINLWFEYPIHKVDYSGVLEDLIPDDSKPAYQKGKEQRKLQAKSKRAEIDVETENAFNSVKAFSENGEVTLKAMAEYLDISIQGLKKRLKRNDTFYSENGVVYRGATDLG